MLSSLFVQLLKKFSFGFVSYLVVLIVSVLFKILWKECDTVSLKKKKKRQHVRFENSGVVFETDREEEKERWREEGGEGPHKCQTTSLDTRWILSVLDSSQTSVDSGF